VARGRLAGAQSCTVLQTSPLPCCHSPNSATFLPTFTHVYSFAEILKPYLKDKGTFLLRNSASSHNGKGLAVCNGRDAVVHYKIDVFRSGKYGIQDGVCRNLICVTLVPLSLVSIFSSNQPVHSSRIPTSLPAPCDIAVVRAWCRAAPRNAGGPRQALHGDEGWALRVVRFLRCTSDSRSPPAVNDRALVRAISPSLDPRLRHLFFVAI
jgi:hypothetical protein